MTLEQLCQQFRAGKKFKYLFFWGHQSKSQIITKSCLSQWYPAQFSIDNIRYGSAEHYMMAEKARLFNDHDTLEKIITAKNPGAVKAFGREVKRFDQNIWNENRFQIVVNGNIAKFTQNSECKQFLLNTQNRILVEASPVDKVWGIGLAETEENIENPLTWRGLNLLGFALMAARSALTEK